MNKSILSKGARVLSALSAAMLACSGAAARDITPQEFRVLSPMCQAVFGNKEIPRKQRLAPYEHLLVGSCGIHHTCNGELAQIRYQQLMAKRPSQFDEKARVRFERQRKGALGAIVGEYSYEIRCAPSTYPLLPTILTERGKALALQGKHADAARDFQRALALEPGNAAARQGLVASQARAAVPK